MSRMIAPQKTELMKERKIPLSSSIVTPIIDKTMVPGKNMKFVKALSMAIMSFLTFKGHKIEYVSYYISIHIQKSICVMFSGPATVLPDISLLI